MPLHLYKFSFFLPGFGHSIVTSCKLGPFDVTHFFFLYRKMKRKCWSYNVVLDSEQNSLQGSPFLPSYILSLWVGGGYVKAVIQQLMLYQFFTCILSFPDHVYLFFSCVCLRYASYLYFNYLGECRASHRSTKRPLFRQG